MRAIAATYGIERGTVLALAAGADAICVGGGLADEDTVLRLRDALVARGARRRTARGAARRRRRPGPRARRLDAGRPRRPRRRRAQPGPTPASGLAAARRALRVTRPGRDRSTGRPPYVAAFTPVANIAVGDETRGAWPRELARLLPGTDDRPPTARPTTARLDRPGRRAVLAAAADRRIVAVVRDVHRHAWMAAALARAARRPARRRSWWRWAYRRHRPAGALHIATHGAARVCGRAAAEVIAGKDAGR